MRWQIQNPYSSITLIVNVNPTENYKKLINNLNYGFISNLIV